MRYSVFTEQGFMPIGPKLEAKIKINLSALGIFGVEDEYHTTTASCNSAAVKLTDWSHFLCLLMSISCGYHAPLKGCALLLIMT